MCYFPRLVPNPKYKKTKKNGGLIPTVKDERVMMIPIGCGECRECRKQKRREWHIRLLEEIKGTTLKGHMVTLTFSTESLKVLNENHLTKKIDLPDGTTKKIKIPIKEIEGYDKDNAIATRAMELFRERWRKEHEIAVRRFTITELGNGKWEHMHIHGIIWTDKPKSEIQKHWQYGKVWSGNNGKDTYVNETTIAYITKYITKLDPNHKSYKPIILCSPGIGKDYTNTQKSKDNIYKENNTNEAYKTNTGHKIALPIYYRNKIYSEEEREQLWIQKLDKQERYLNGKKYDVSKSNTEYLQALAYAQHINKELGYGDNTINWTEKNYEKQRRKLLHKRRLNNNENAPREFF
nr:MAG: replication initiator protein [Microviridae sp.]